MKLYKNKDHNVYIAINKKKKYYGFGKIVYQDGKKPFSWNYFDLSFFKEIDINKVPHKIKLDIIKNL